MGESRPSAKWSTSLVATLTPEPPLARGSCRFAPADRALVRIGAERPRPRRPPRRRRGRSAPRPGAGRHRANAGLSGTRADGCRSDTGARRTVQAAPIPEAAAPRPGRAPTGRSIRSVHPAHAVDGDVLDQQVVLD